MSAMDSTLRYSLADRAKEITTRELATYAQRTRASQRAYDPYPIVVRVAQGSWMEDVDGNRYTDFDLAFAQWIHGINRGILLPPGLDEQWLISVMHSDTDAMHYADVFSEFVDELIN